MKYFFIAFVLSFSSLASAEATFTHEEEMRRFMTKPAITLKSLLDLHSGVIIQERKILKTVSQYLSDNPEHQANLALGKHLKGVDLNEVSKGKVNVKAIYEGQEVEMMKCFVKKNRHYYGFSEIFTCE